MTALHGGARRRVAARLRAGVALTVCSLYIVGCIIPTEVAFPAQAVAFKPPPEFAVWWRVTEACSGLERDYTRVSWFVVPGDQLVVRGHSYDGYSWQGADPRIVLTQSMLRNAGDLVRHEMLHVIIGQGGHSREYFRIRCGDIVACADECADGAGTWASADASSPVVDPRSLLVTLSVARDSVARGVDGWMSIVLTSHNPSKQPVRVRLSPHGDPETTANESFWVVMPRGTVSTYISAPLVEFDAGQTRRFVFDTKAFVPYPFPPNGDYEYTITGGFSGAPATPVRIHVSP